MSPSRSLLLALAVSSLGLLLESNCNNDNISGGGTTTGNPSVTAMLRNPGGSPAAHAKVMFVPVNHNPDASLAKALATVDSTTTDANGNYKATLDTGTYNVLASGDSGLAYQDSIKTVKDSVVRPPNDTLKAPGGVRGVVRLQPNDDSRTVFILFMGTVTWALPADSIGNFDVTDLAAGTYRVRILTTLDQYQPMDTALTVPVGRDSVLPDTIRLRFTGIPVVTGLKLTYDTLMEIVTLTWDRADTSLVASYNVYRRNAGLNTVFARINVSSVTDTTFRDSSVVEDSTYEYEAVAANASGTEGARSPAFGVKAVGSYTLARTLASLAGRQPYGLQVTAPGDIVYADHNGSALVVIDSIGDAVKTIDLRDTSGSLMMGLWGLAIAPDSTYYVASENGLFHVDSTGRALVKYDSTENPNIACDIALADSSMFVTFAHAVRKYSAANVLLSIFASDEFAPGYVRQPDGIVVSSDSVLVFDEVNAQVQVYTQAGAFLGSWGTIGAALGQFTQSASRMTMDSHGRLIVTQQQPLGRIQILEKNGTLVCRFAIGRTNVTPLGMTLDEADNIFLSVRDEATSQYSILVYRR